LPTVWLNSSTTFLFLNTDGRVAASHHPEIDMIRADFTVQGMESAHYLSNRIPSLTKLIDDLEALGSHNLVFYCVPSNYRLSKTISRRLKEADQSLKIIWFGPLIGVHANAILRQEVADACAEKLSAEALLPLLKNWKSIDNGSELASGDIMVAQTLMKGQEYCEKEEEIVDAHMSLGDYARACSGLYSASDLRGYVQHLFCSASEINQLPKYQSYSDINCVVIATSPQHNKFPDSVYQEFQDSSQENNCYYRHLYQDENTGSYRLSIDRNNCGPNILQLPYAQAKLAPQMELCLLTIDKLDDLNAFLQDAEHFFETGSLAKDYELTTILQDSCRWMGRGYCHVRNLPRLFSRNEKLFPCRDCSKSIGTAGESFYSLKTRLNIFLEMALADRNCFECRAQWCPQCSFLPDFLDQSQYCTLMRQKPYISAYLQTKSILRVLRNSSSIFRDAKAADLKISTPGVSHFLPLKSSGEGVNQISKHVYLFTVKNTPLVFNASSNKLIKINEPLTLVFEALIKSVNFKELQTYLTQRYKQNSLDIESFIKHTMDKFVEAGFVSIEA